MLELLGTFGGVPFALGFAVAWFVRGRRLVVVAGLVAVAALASIAPLVDLLEDPECEDDCPIVLVPIVIVLGVIGWLFGVFFGWLSRRVGHYLRARQRPSGVMSRR
jgi:H+/Cl- antiporter ClcA